MKTMTRWALMCAAVVGTVGSAQQIPGFGNSVKPRVLVIVDTSRSMRAKPTYNDDINNGPIDTTTYDINTLPDGGSTNNADYNGSSCPVGASSKFCIAKEALSTTIPSYTTDAVVGLAGYYQYVLRQNPIDTRSSSCLYDVIVPPGQTRTFTTPADYTATGRSGCLAVSPYTCTGVTTSTPVFPDQYLGSANPLFPTASCTSGTGTTYTLTKTSATPGMLTYCNQFNYYAASVGSPKVFTTGALPSGCTANIAYESWDSNISTGLKIWGATVTAGNATNAGTPSGFVEQQVTTLTGTCSPGVTVPTTLPVTTAATLNNITSTSGLTGLPTAISSNVCTAANPCRLYSAGATPRLAPSARRWILPANLAATGSFPAFTPSPTQVGLSGTTTPAYQLNGTGTLSGIAPTAVAGGNATGTVTGVSVTTGCQPSGRKVTGSLEANYGFAAGALSTAAGNTTATDESPGFVTPNHNCSAAWPCDVTTTPGAPTDNWVFTQTHYTKDLSLVVGTGNGATRYLATPTTGTFLLNNPTMTSCPAIPATGALPAMPAGSTFSGTAPPATTGTGIGAQVFTNTAGPTTITDATCPTLYDSSQAASPPAGSGACAGRYTQTGAAATISPTSTSSATTQTGSAPACLANGTLMNNGVNGAHTVSGCADGNCKINSSTSTTSTPSNGPSFTQNTSPGAQFLYRTDTTTATTYDYVPTPVPGNAGNGGPCEVVNGTLVTNVGGGRSGIVLGTTKNGVLNDPSGTCVEKTCACRVALISYTWTGNQTRTCTYNVTRKTFNAPTKQCTYTRPAWTFQTNNQIMTCTYTVPTRRYDFSVEGGRFCPYYMVQQRLQYQGYNFGYSYQTNGTEVGNVYAKPVTSNISACDQTVATPALYSTYQTDCPSVMSCPAGVTIGSGPTLLSGASLTCRLRFSGADSRLARMNTPRVTNAANGTKNVDFSTTFTNRECGSTSTSTPAGTTALAAAPESYKANFCSYAGSLGPKKYHIISDHYDPVSAVNLPTIFPNTAMGFASYYADAQGTYTLSWSRTNTTRANGLGIEGNLVGTTHPIASPVLVKLPTELPGDPYVPATQQTQLVNALKGCVQPSDSTVFGAHPANPQWQPTSLCVAERAGRDNGQLAVANDNTPLYGSLVNAKDYMSRLLDSDTASQCRKYYLLLMTDGLEETPFTLPQSLPSLVGSFTNMTGFANTSKSTVMKTFVIGFGSGAAGASTLDQMAQAGLTDTRLVLSDGGVVGCSNPCTGSTCVSPCGGTGVAYNATDLNSLQTSLNQIFTQITSGSFSRSKPILSTDGSRVYSARFERSSASPEWSGALIAYGLDYNGDPVEKWNSNTKLNGQTDSARVLKADVNRVLYDFVEPAVPVSLSTALMSSGLVPGGVTAGQIVKFVRNASMNEPFLASSLKRLNRTGSIINGTPTIVGPPSFGQEWGGPTFAHRSAYQSFKTANQSRETRVLINSNDGIMRSLAENTTANCSGQTGTAPNIVQNESLPACENGKERWGYVPAKSVSNLYKMLNGGDTGSRDILDGQVAASDINSSTWTEGANGNADSTSASDWKTVAIGSMRGGGMSLFGLDVTNPNSVARLWEFGNFPSVVNGGTMGDTGLGYTYSAPAIGRIKVGSNDKFVAILGAGARQTAVQSVGRSAYVINAGTGALISGFPDVYRGTTVICNGSNGPSCSPSTSAYVNREMISRPAVFRQKDNPYISAAVLPGTDGVLSVMRFFDAAGAPDGTQANWAPQEFFNPSDVSRMPNTPDNVVAPILKVGELTAGNPDAGVPPTYGLVNVAPLVSGGTSCSTTLGAGGSCLPLTAATPVPFYNRPKVAAVLDPAGKAGDYYFGTGNSIDPVAAVAGGKNYFYAVHDLNQRLAAKNDGQPLFVRMFINADEQVVSEPALVNGSVIVATYRAPTSSAVCTEAGDTTLYSFDPKTGALVNSLQYLTGPYASGSSPFNSVMKFPGFGIPSDLLVVNDTLYFTSSNSPGVTKQTYSVVVTAGAIKSMRRVK